MRLASFQITNFRSINDSGSIDTSQITAILGRNDSGKSNLLRALHSLNPAEGLAELSPIKDFPRHRRLEECQGDTPVVATRWALEDSERAELAQMLPRAAKVRHVTAGRGYGTARWSGLEGLGDLSLDVSDIKAKVRKIVPAVKAAAEKLADDARAMLEQAADAFDAAMILSPDYIRWSTGAVAALQSLRQAMAAADAELSDKQEQMLAELEEMARAIANDTPALARAKQWVLDKLPRFVYVDEYPALPGRQNIAEHLARKGWGRTRPGSATSRSSARPPGSIRSSCRSCWRRTTRPRATSSPTAPAPSSPPRSAGSGRTASSRCASTWTGRTWTRWCPTRTVPTTWK